MDDLLSRLRRDTRHTGIEVRDERSVSARSFPDWTMELVRVSSSYSEARDAIQDRVPMSVEPDVRDRLFRMTEQISGTVRL